MADAAESARAAADEGSLDGFARYVREQLAEMYPPELHDPNAETDPHAIVGGREFAGSSDPQSVWMRRMAAKGWTAPTWPKAYGGAGLSAEEAAILQQELEAGGYRKPIASMGISMLGPVLLEIASEEQKRQHLPAIAAGEIRWCQGYSEPGSGSDLASLQTRCEDKGDHWLINGAKIWTSWAHRSDWCFCLVRTDTTKKQDGISFVLIDMATPGVEARPIDLMSGQSPFAETFFNNVAIPKDNLVGNLNGGWAIAKRLLQFERQNLSSDFGEKYHEAGGSDGDLADIVRRYTGESGRISDGDMRARITRNKMDFDIFRQTVARIVAETAGSGPSTAASIIKYSVAKFAQERSELIIEAMGQQGLGWTGPEFTESELIATRGWLRSKANSIEGGTSEVNLNIIAKRVLGLPDLR